MKDDVTIEMHPMARFTADRFEIEVGPGETFRWIQYPGDVTPRSLDDLQSMIAVATAALNWYRTR